MYRIGDQVRVTINLDFINYGDIGVILDVQLDWLYLMTRFIVINMLERI